MVFDITSDHIAGLSDEDLRILVAYLCEQEVLRKGFSPSAVTYGGNQNAPDGGIDVRVDLGDVNIEGYLPRAKVGFQAKAENFPPEKIKKEISPNGKLRASIEGLISLGGAYIIASSRSSVSDSFLEKRKQAMTDAIAFAPGANVLFLDFYDSQRLATWTNQHPGVALWLRGRIGQPLHGWKPFGDWSSSPGDTDEGYLVSEDTRLNDVRKPSQGSLDIVAGIERIRGILKEPNGVVRLVGLSGVGKTRFAQALFDERRGQNSISPHLAVYTDISDEPDPPPLALLERLASFGQRCIMIVDNCGPELHGKLAKALKDPNTPVSLLTIEYDISDDEPEGTDVFSLEPATDDLIKEILKRRYPVLSQPDIQTIAEFSGGNFRIALALANTAKTGDSLAKLTDSVLFERLFQQKNPHDPSLLKTARVCSLVYSFDGETLDGEEAELPILAEISGQTVRDFYDNVATLKQRKLVQSRSKWRALLPQALAHKLAKEALQTSPQGFLITQFRERAPKRLLKSFARRLGGLHDSSEARSIVECWLGTNGWLSSIENLSDFELAVLHKIAPVMPESVLEIIKFAEDRNPKLLSREAKYREGTLHLLRSISYDSTLFDDAIEIIAKLVPNDANDVNAATGVYKSLFFIYLSGTLAPPEQRANFLRTLLQNPTPKDCKLFLIGLEAMFECIHFSSTYNFEFGARKRGFGLTPRSREEIKGWYWHAIQVASEASKLALYRGEVRKLVANQFCNLVCDERLTNELVLLGEELMRDGGWPQGWVNVRKAVRILRHTKRRSDYKILSKLAKSLFPRSLWERIVTYVLPKQWSEDDISMLHIGNESYQASENEKIHAICEEIGAELGCNLVLLKEFLPTLLDSDTAQNRVRPVIESIGKESVDPARTWETMAETVLSGRYGTQASEPLNWLLSGLREINVPLVEFILDNALKDVTYHPYFIGLQVCAGLGESGYQRLMEAVELETVPTLTFRHLHQNGGLGDSLKPNQFHLLLTKLTQRDGGLSIALRILYMRILRRPGDPKRLSKPEKNLGRELLIQFDFSHEFQIEDYLLKIIIDTCLFTPEDADVCMRLCESLSSATKSGATWGQRHKYALGSLLNAHPRIVLDILLNNDHLEHSRLWDDFGDPDARTDYPLDKVSGDELTAWADVEPATRYLLLARFVRAWNTTTEKAPQNLHWTHTARVLIRRAPEPLTILETFFRRFEPQCVWRDELAEILRNRMVLLDALLDEPDVQIAAWAQEAKATLQQKIDQEIERSRVRCRETNVRFE